MITTSDYILKVTAEDGDSYIFTYDAQNVWEALEAFWHEDYPDYLSDLDMNTNWPIDVYAMNDSEVVKTYRFKFCTSAFHGYFDHGRCTLDEFHGYIRRKTYGKTLQMVCDQIAEFTGDSKKEAMRKARLFRSNCLVPLTQVENIRLSFGRKQDGEGRTVFDFDTLHFKYKDSDGDSRVFSILD